MNSRLYDQLSAGLFIALAGVVLLTFSHYGVSWDEPYQQSYGEAVVRFYTTGFEDRNSMVMGDLFYYGGFFEALTALVVLISPFTLEDTRHLLSALTGVLGIVACWKLARFIGGSGGGFWAALLLALCPPYYGHIFINSKDIPFAVFSMWALYYMTRLLVLPQFSWQAAVKFGISAGLALGVRVGGLLLLCYFFLFAALSIGYTAWWERVKLASRARTVVLSGSIGTILGFAIMLLSWPYAMIKPFKNPLNALAWFSRPSDPPSPRDYIVRHLVYKLPEIVLLLLICGLCVAVYRLMRNRTLPSFWRAQPYLLLIFAVIFPIAYTSSRQMRIYDEARHFLFVVPPLFCLCGLIVNGMMESSAGRKTRVMVGSLLMLGLFLPFSTMIQLHPYEYAYYNRLIGGVRGAFEKGYATEYWATSYKEGVKKLEDYFRMRDGEAFSARQYKIRLGDAQWGATAYFPANFVTTEELPDADAYLSTTRYSEPSLIVGKTIVEVGRFGVPFMIGKIPERMDPPR